jgi:hypothetical protein
MTVMPRPNKRRMITMAAIPPVDKCPDFAAPFVGETEEELGFTDAVGVIMVVAMACP